MLKLNSSVVLALVLAGSSALFVAAAQGMTGHNMAGHTMPMPAPLAAKAAPLPLTAQNATIVAVPPSIKETSAFVTLKNTGKQPVKLTGVSAQIAGSAMLMKTLKTGNMTGMVGAPVLIVPAGGTLTLKNDGDHIMLTGLKRALKVGEVLPIVLTDATGRSVTIKATVKKP